MSLLDQVSSKLSGEERTDVDALRRAVGYLLPSVRDIAEVSERFLSGIVVYFGDRARRRREAAQTDEV
ncbi:hypothetical protein ABZW30_03410 [Kitasatospora sp. NPDC004669]|uniref:hypothetical protein n=1 Tax=Kitasatospora sp. NPDC004669 TaxID=3154555 RepID=UPI0033A646E6